LYIEVVVYMVFYVPYSARGGDESRISATKISHEKRERERSIVAVW